jgi:hypothetical protein
MTIGITGHQKLHNDLILEWLESEIVREVTDMHGLENAFSSLAIGADQLFARNMIQLNINLIAIIPCKNYEQTFDEINRQEYFHLLTQCQKIETLNFPTPSELAFFSAGKQVVHNSDVLFAIWDGNPAQGLGGTGDIVAFAMSLGKTIIHLNSTSKNKRIYNRG